MKISRSTQAIVIALVGVALVSAAPATGDGGRTEATPGVPATGSDDEKVIVRRDGSSAVPFVPYVGGSSTVTERDGFDWGDAAIGAGSAFSVLLLASAVLVMTRRRAQPGMRTTVGAAGS